MDGATNFAFAFNVSPTACIANYYKLYEVSVTKDGAAVSMPSWLTLTSDQTSPYLTANTSTVSHYGTYIVTVRSILYTESSFDRSIVFELFLTPCQITTETIPNLSIGIGNKLIQSAHPVFYYTHNVSGTITTCGPIIYELINGDTAYLFYNTSTRVFTFWPKSTAYQITQAHTLRLKPTNY